RGGPHSRLETGRFRIRRRDGRKRRAEQGADGSLSVLPVEGHCKCADYARLASAAISTRIVQELGGATVIGPLIVGIEKPVQIVTLGAKDSDIVNTAAIATAPCSIS